MNHDNGVPWLREKFPHRALDSFDTLARMHYRYAHEHIVEREGCCIPEHGGFWSSMEIMCMHEYGPYRLEPVSLWHVVWRSPFRGHWRFCQHCGGEFTRESMPWRIQFAGWRAVAAWVYGHRECIDAVLASEVRRVLRR